MRTLASVQKRSNGVYYLRLFIPKPLIPKFGRVELTKSLGTKRKGEAARAAEWLQGGFFRVKQMARENPNLSPDNLQELAKRYFDWALAEAEKERTRTRIAPRDRETLLNSHAEMLQMLNQWLDRQEVGLGPRYIDGFLKTESLEIDHDSPEYEALAQSAMRSQAEIHRREYDFVASAAIATPSVSTSATSVGPDQNAPSEISFKHAIRKFLKEYERVISEQTYLKYSANLTVCLEILGDLAPLSSISKAHIRKIKETLENLPANWSKAYPNLSFEEVIERAKADQRELLSPNSVNAYLGSLSSLFRWAEKVGYANSNPVSGIRSLDPVSPDDKRHPFSSEQLQAIFSAPIYTGMESRRKWASRGELIDLDARYWLPLVALFTGMRLGEILALTKADILTDSSVLAFDIKAAKTHAGVRRIPIHSQLMESGLADYLEPISDDQPLFPGFTQKAYSKFFRRFQHTAGIRDRKLVFHSLRHNFVDALRASRIEQPLAKALIGHSNGSVTDRYGSGYPIGVLSEAINSIAYEGITLSRP